MEKGLVSVVMPTYNCARFIKETIMTVVNQTYSNWEIIVVDDCSTDNTKEIVDEIAKEYPQIKYHCLETNSGAAVARTTAMEIANGQYIAFLDSDDLWTADKLTKQIAFMEDNNYAFSCTDYSQVDEDGIDLNKVIKCRKKANYNNVLLTCPIGNSSVVFDQSKLGKFIVPNIRKRNDDALWLQILKVEKNIYGLNETLMNYRVRKNSISSNKLSLLKYHWILYRKIEKLSIIRSWYHINVWIFLKLFRIK